MRTFTVFAANGTNMRGVYWYKNGAGLMITMGKAGWGGGLNFETGWLSVGAGDYFEQQVYQDSGGALNFSPGTASSQGGIAWWEIELAP
jgi:hypothetical protein